MLYCAICDKSISASQRRDISAVIIGKAVERGLRPPTGKFRRSARMMAQGDEAVARKEAELEAQWTERFTTRSGMHVLCLACRNQAKHSVLNDAA